MLNIDIGISKEMQLVNVAINEYINCGVETIENVAHHVIDSGGKRIRPAVLLASYAALNGDSIEETIPLAAAFELIHTGTLIHDDINDRSTLRRGFQTAHKEFGTSSALLTGDYVFIKGFDIVKDYSKEIIKIVVDSCITMAAGEMEHSQRKTDLELTEKDYLRIISDKTAISISACARCGGTMASGTRPHINSLSKYGLEIGTGFQIVDDILDVIGDEKSTGKVVGNDIREGKHTILTIHAMENSNSKDSARLREIMLEERNTMEEVTEAIDIITDSGSIDYAMKLGKSFGEKAKNHIQDLPDPKGQKGLMSLADFTIGRDG